MNITNRWKARNIGTNLSAKCLDELIPIYYKYLKKNLVVLILVFFILWNGIYE